MTIFASHESLSICMVLEGWARTVSSFLLRTAAARAKAWTTAPWVVTMVPKATLERDFSRTQVWVAYFLSCEQNRPVSPSMRREDRSLAVWFLQPRESHILKSTKGQEQEKLNHDMEEGAFNLSSNFTQSKRHSFFFYAGECQGSGKHFRWYSDILCRFNFNCVKLGINALVFKT